MQQKIDDGILFVKASKEEGSMIRSWRMMTYDKAKGYWFGQMSIPLLENLMANGGLIPPAKEALAEMKRIQAAIDAERMKPDEEVRCYIEPPVKATLYAHQRRAMNMALINFGLIEPDQIKEDKKCRENANMPERS